MIVLINSQDASQRSTRAEFEEFIASVRPKLERALTLRYGVSDGPDAAAEAIAYAWAHWPRIEEMANPEGYLWRVGQSAARALRASARRPRLPEESAQRHSIERVELPRALARLRPPVRVAVVLVHGYGLSYSEVASLLDVPVSTVRNHVHRGTKVLRKRLGDST